MEPRGSLGGHALHWRVISTAPAGRRQNILLPPTYALYTSPCSLYCEAALDVPGFTLSPLPTYYIPEGVGSLAAVKEYLGTLPAIDRCACMRVHWGWMKEIGQPAMTRHVAPACHTAVLPRPCQPPAPPNPAAHTTTPRMPRPEAFGQHPNASVATAVEEGRALLAALAGLAPKADAGGGGGAPAAGGDAGTPSAADDGDGTTGEGGHSAAPVASSPEAVVLSVTADLLDTVPGPFDLEAIMAAKASDPSALHVVLLQEVERYNALLLRVRAGCAQLQSGLRGLTVMSADLDQVWGGMLGTGGAFAGGRLLFGVLVDAWACGRGIEGVAGSEC